MTTDAGPEDGLIRCFGGPEDPLMMSYHDEQWGVPVHDDLALFELLSLEAFQAGLSWRTILHKRDNFRRAFEGFNPEKVSRYGEPDSKRLLADAGIVRNRLKVAATIRNAQLFLEVRSEHVSFDRYMWQFTGHGTLRNPEITIETMPAFTPESDAMSSDLKKRGFKFVGTTICYAFMQSAGMVNDHVVGCFRAPED